MNVAAKKVKVPYSDQKLIAQATGFSLSYIYDVLHPGDPRKNALIEELAHLSHTDRVQFEIRRREIMEARQGQTQQSTAA